MAEDAKMEEVEEEQKDISPELLKKRFWDKWRQTIDEDFEDLQDEPADQRPLSRAYLSLCPANRTSNKQVQDEKTSSQDYLAQGQKLNFKEDHVRQTIRANLMKAGFPQQKVDEVMGNVEHLPAELVGSFYEMMREDLRERIR